MKQFSQTSLGRNDAESDYFLTALTRFSGRTHLCESQSSMSYPLAIDNGCLSMKIHLNDEKKTRIKKQEISIIFLSSIKMIHSSSSQSSISFSLMHKQPVTQFFIKVCSRSAQRDDVDIVHCEKGNEKKTICSS